MKTQRRFRCQLTALLVTLGATSVSADDIRPIDHSQSIVQLSKILDQVAPVNKALARSDDFKQLKLALDTVKALQDQKKYTGSITLALRSDDATDDEAFQINGGVAIQRGTFPSQLSAAYNIAVQSDGDSLTEDLSTLRVSYDHYFDPFRRSDQDWQARLENMSGTAINTAPNDIAERVNFLIEGFSFGERFSNQFMSIDERYEVGLGAKFELNFSSLSNARGEFKIADPFRQLPAREAIMRTLFESDKASNSFRKRTSWLAKQIATVHFETFKVPLCKTTETAKKEVIADCAEKIEKHIASVGQAIRDDRNLRGAINRTTSRFELGLSAALVGEFEQATVNVRLHDDDAGEESDPVGISIPASRTTRLSIRPSFVYRINDTLSVNGQFYWKQAIGDSKIDGVRDIRREWRFGLNYALEGGTIVLAYNRYHDRTPPTPSCLQLGTAFPMIDQPCVGDAADPGVFRVFRGAKNHEFVTLNFTLPIK